MKIAIICVGVVTLRFRTVPPHGSSNKTRVNRAMPHHRIIYQNYISIIPAPCCIYVVNVYNICFLYLCYTPYGVKILRINYCHCHHI